MEMPKPTAEDRDRFAEMVPDAEGVAVKPMFGNLGAFVNGNMFMGLFGSAIGLKLTEPDHGKLLAQPGAGPYGPAERPMSGYVTLPADWSAEEAKPWIERALASAAALPPKQPKSKAKKRAS